ncbi:MAG: CoA-transferase [Candidatus Jordarchaeales archaeon]
MDLFKVEFEGENKLMSIKDAVESFVKPGSLIHIGATNTLPYCFCYELCRVFWGKKPGFRLLTLGGGINIELPVYGGLVSEVITSYAGHVYPSPAPSPVIQKSYISGSVKFENWSILTICQSLMAGALDLEFMPTKSIAGSSMEENEGFKFVKDPFTGRAVGVVRGIKPDVSVYHGWCADREGNTIMFPPSAEGVIPWGAYASKGGVIVTVEKIVEREFIMRNAHLVRIPGYLVRAVVEAPFGAHPSAFYVPESFGGGYAEDYDFIVDFRRATESEEKLHKWVEEWILSVDHEGYLKKLGFERLFYLVGKAKSDSWKHELRAKEKLISKSEEPTSVERMILVGARKIAEKCVEKGYRVVLAGIGGANLAAWMAAYMLRERGYNVDLVAEVGFYGYLPRPANPFVFNMTNIHTCKGLFGSMQVLGAIMGRENNKGMGVLGAGQVDKYGNINSTLIPGVMYLVGSGGANDVASTAEEIVVLVKHSPLRLVEKVPYITAPGRRVTMVVTTMGVLEKVGGELVLTEYFPQKGLGREEVIERIKSETGWNLRISDRVKEAGLLSVKELYMLRCFDPDKNFLQD